MWVADFDLYFFFFKQETAYEMRISDWSSDVCSSDLKKYAFEELIAEVTAAFCCASLSIAPTVRHADYIGSWLDVLREDDRAIVRAASAASKAADYILGFETDTKCLAATATVEDAREEAWLAPLHIPAPWRRTKSSGGPCPASALGRATVW